MTRPIGYYVHHHGDGHRARALAIAQALGDRTTLIGTRLEGRTGTTRSVDLPDDRMAGSAFDGRDDTATRPASLHYAPVDHEGVRQRTAMVAGWIARERPALIVVDVSVEMAMLARLASTPTIYVRLAGIRGDPAHFDAFRGAEALLAPFAQALDDPEIASWIMDKTVYCPGLTPIAPALHTIDGDILVILGAGGTAVDGAALVAAARATPERCWRVAGEIVVTGDVPHNLTLLGWIDDVATEVGRARIIIGGAGDGVVSLVLAFGKPFICIPEARPYDEQISKARQLAAAGAAVVQDRWPPHDAWPALLMKAAALDPSHAVRLHDRNGPSRAADLIRATADRWS